MKHLIKHALSLVVIVLAFQTAFTQSDLSGTWAGALTTTSVGPGGMELILARDRASWTPSLRMRIGADEHPAPLSDLKIDGDNMSFNAEVDKSVVKFAGKFAGNKLNGTLEAFRGDQKIVDGAFALTRGGAMPPVQQATGGQMADPNFNAKVDKPAYQKNGPKVLFDEAHNNFHTSTGRYKPFADLITNDGYQIVPNKEKFSVENLKRHNVLVISNALGAARMNDPEAGNPAFTDEESDAVRDWVKGGGSLLLIADHAPMGAANQSLAQRFGVDMSKMFTLDNENYDKESDNPGFIVYTRESGRLADHPVTRGRNESERINKIITFTGQSLKGPPDASPFLKLSDTALDAMPGRNTNPASAAGRAQGIAMNYGKGRVVILGEAGMLSAQVVGPQHLAFGMNRPGIDNRQLALNIMHWLSGLLK